MTAIETEERFGELATLIDSLRRGPGSSLAKMPDADYIRFHKLWTIWFEREQLSSRQVAWLDIFELRLIRLVRTGEWHRPEVETQEKFFQEAPVP